MSHGAHPYGVRRLSDHLQKVGVTEFCGAPLDRRDLACDRLLCAHVARAAYVLGVAHAGRSGGATGADEILPALADLQALGLAQRMPPAGIEPAHVV